MTKPKPYRRAGRSSQDAHLLLTLRLTPKAVKDVIDGVDVSQLSAGARAGSSADGKNGGGTASAKTATLTARVRAVPEKGKANAALEKLVAKWLGLAKSSVSVTAGGKSRLKTLRLDGDPDELAAKLDEAIARLD